MTAQSSPPRRNHFAARHTSLGGRALAALCAALVLVAALLGVWLFAQLFEAHTQERLATQQNTEADLWARMLTARMEAHQRLLTSIAQGMHSSLLDQPAVLDALMQQDGSMLRLFDSLHVALPSGQISHHSIASEAAELTVWGADALRRTLVEGKPSVVHMPAPQEAQYLRVLLTVPMRLPEGPISGALAAVVKLPLAALLPESSALQNHVQYMLLDSEGVVVVHSDPAVRWRHVQDLWPTHWQQWQTLSQPSVASADTQQWGGVLITRVGMPQPQWQVVVVRDMRADLQLPTGWRLPVAVGWLVALALAMLVVLLLLSARQRGIPGGGQLLPALDNANLPVEKEVDFGAPNALAMLELVPSALLLERGGQVQVATPQVAVILGYFMSDGVLLAMEQLFAKPLDLQQVRHALVDFGSYEGVLPLRKKDGGVAQVEVWVGHAGDSTDSTVWRLRLPWREHQSLPLPGDAQQWRDSLTGLPNRDACMWGLQVWRNEGLQSATASDKALAQQVPSLGCLLFADIDHLGLLNEVTSRDMGNKVVRYVGRLMANHTRPLGQVYRLGGDEFAVLLPGISLAHAQGVAQALCDAVARWQPHWSGERQWVSISVGIVAVDAQRHSPLQALRAADMACYEAKRRGRGQVAVGQIGAAASADDADVQLASSANPPTA